MRAPLTVALTALVAVSANTAVSQESPMHAGTLAHALDRIAVTGRVLYVAAHPDDENTRLLAWLANARHFDATYLSMTRGGGGQNLIGREQAELLDVIRTEELLAARRIDGARQRFTRMRDFGYSKSADETFRIWGHEAALADVVWAIRSLQPDVIVTRFDEKPPNHGHHTASAILAREAFLAAGDPAAFPEQLTRGVKPWKAARLLYNVPTWRDEPPPAEALAIDVGAYDPRTGLSYGELAARSRSQHQSQGFGVSGERGPVLERFVTLAGSPASKDPFEGIPVGWERYGEAGAPVTRAIEKARTSLELDRPERILPALLEAHRALDGLPAEPRVVDARAAVERLAASASGLFVRATAPTPGLVPGQRVKIAVEVIGRRPAPWSLTRLRFPDGSILAVGSPIVPNEKRLLEREVTVAADAPVSVPYWMTPAGSSTPNGEPRGPAPMTVTAEIEAEGRTLRYEVPVQYAWTDPVRGERVRECVIVPPATVTPARESAVALNGKPAPVEIRVRSGVASLKGRVVLPAPAGWRVEPGAVPVELGSPGDEETIRFDVTPPAGAAPASLAPAVEVDGATWAYREDVIDHPHIPIQAIMQPASVRVVRLQAVVPEGLVGYVEGSGDTVADDLRHLGMRVETLDDAALHGADLSRYRAIVIGVRAYNTRPAVRSHHDRLMRYVEDGGTVVVQYNTQNRLGPLEGRVGPFPLEIGRGRVTDERAAMTFLAPDHELLTKPNRIEAADFDGWVQERGLYFASTWDPRYAPILSAADPGEKPLEGGVLFARHGRGRYVFTGLAFFRQLPAGVPGAYRLFLNLLGDPR